MPYRYVDNTMNPTAVANQSNYGPTADINPAQGGQLQGHYGTVNVLARVNQYNARHATYIAAAQTGGRGLTIQENTARLTNAQAPNASINHVIASGTGQNIFNEGTLQFRAGAARVQANRAAALAPLPPQVPALGLGNVQQQGNAILQRGQARREVMHGFAEQVAAVARQQGYSRAIINERGNEPLHNNPSNRRIYGAAQAGGALQVAPTRNLALQHTLTALQGPTAASRFRAYKDVLRMTFDSPGNLRVGDSYGNNLASTGFDMPLTANQQPTARGARLLHAHQTFAPARLLTPNRLFTVTQQNQDRVSSSIQFAPPRIPLMLPGPANANQAQANLGLGKKRARSFQSNLPPRKK